MREIISEVVAKVFDEETPEVKNKILAETIQNILSLEKLINALLTLDSVHHRRGNTAVGLHNVTGGVLDLGNKKMHRLQPVTLKPCL